MDTVRSRQAQLRAAVWDRDGGVCVACPPGTPPWPYRNVQRPIIPDCRRARNGCPAHRWGCPTELVGWEADHVVERADGGSDALDNLETRCLRHHSAKTIRARRVRAARRRARLPAGPISVPQARPDLQGALPLVL